MEGIFNKNAFLNFVNFFMYYILYAGDFSPTKYYCLKLFPGLIIKLLAENFVT